MAFALQTGISFCRVGNRLLFLDADRDRYFCLSERAERCIDGLCEQAAPTAADEAVAARLVARGILVRTDRPGRLAPCPPPPTPDSSVLDRGLGAPRWRVLRATTALVRARIALRILGLRHMLGVIERRKRGVRSSGSAVDADVVAAAFQRAALLVTPLDQCLARSLALAGELVAAGARPDVVIGVRLQPFAAHCWVQHGTVLMNERIDVVREFTPIRVV